MTFKRPDYRVLYLLVLAGLCMALAQADIRSQGLVAAAIWGGALIVSYYYTQHALKKQSLLIVLSSAVLLRLLMFWNLPELSDDFWRFIWDGSLTNSGANPYMILPDVYMEDFHGISKMRAVYGQLNSKAYFTVYPPVNQYIFAVATAIGQSSIAWSVSVMRLFALIIELSGFYALYKTFPRLGIPAERSYWLFLSPVFIVECTGNLHFEGVMIGFLCWALYFFVRKKSVVAVLFFALAILTKLIPIIILPVLWRFLGWKRSLIYTGVLVVSCLMISLPFLSWEVVQHFASSIDLYFRTFEFNASVYFLLRDGLTQVVGYNTIAYLGPILALITLSLGLYWAWIRKWDKSSMAVPMIATLGTYFLLSTTVHPWYGCTIIFLAVIIGSRGLIISGSALVLSYLFYTNNVFEHQSWWLLLEYFIVTIGVVWAWRSGELNFQERHSSSNLTREESA